MSEEFDRDLDAVFEDRVPEFSSELRKLLRELYDQGVLEGRGRERAEHLEMMGSKLSECRTYWCTPLNKAMLVLGGARVAAEALEQKIRRHPRRLEAKYSSPFDELLASMDGEIIEKLRRQAEARERWLPGGLVVLRHRPEPRVPARQHANLWPYDGR